MHPDPKTVREDVIELNKPFIEFMLAKPEGEAEQNQEGQNDD